MSITIDCKSLKKGTVTIRPVKTKKIKVRKRYFVYTVYYDLDGEFLFLKKRTAKDIWQNLFDFELQELEDEKSFLKKIKSQKKTKISNTVCRR